MNFEKDTGSVKERGARGKRLNRECVKISKKLIK